VTELGISLGWSFREPIEKVIELVRRAEAEGVNTCWVIDSQMAMRDAFALLAVLAQNTTKIAIGPGVTNLVTRHETVVANSLATLAALAPGRTLAGVGAGDSAVFPIGLKPQTVLELKATLARLAALLNGREVDGPNTPYSIAAATTPRPPIFLAGSQPRMLELAGAEADGVIVMGPADPEVWQSQLNHINAGAREAGRDPAEVARDFWVTMAVGDDAIDSVRSWASAQARWLARWRQVPPSLNRFSAEMRASAEAYDFAKHLSVSADHARAVSDELAGALAVTGTVGECIRRLEELIASRPDRITITLLSGGRQRRLDDLLEVWAGVRAAVIS
jgi:5,10-methylenetetrahydromethanopterin reductase